MPTYLRAYRAQDVSQEMGTPIRFVASTEGVKRDGLEVGIEAWELGNYKRNPVFLWAHDYFGRTLPIGRAEAFVDGERLMADVTFDPDDEFAVSVERKYRKGFLNAVSVGWDTLAFEPSKNPDTRGRVLKAELLDISAVPVPGDPDALKERQLRGLQELGTVLSRLDLEDTTPDDAAWEQTAIEMMRLFDPATRKAEAEWLKTYNRLEARYRKLGRQAPERLPVSTLQALGPAEVRGLFLAGEPELWPGLFAEARAGAVLNQRNHDDLSQAVTLIQGVLARAEKAPEEKPEEKPAETGEAERAATERAATERAAKEAQLRQVLENLKTITA